MMPAKAMHADIIQPLVQTLVDPVDFLVIGLKFIFFTFLSLKPSYILKN